MRKPSKPVRPRVGRNHAIIVVMMILPVALPPLASWASGLLGASLNEGSPSKIHNFGQPVPFLADLPYAMGKLGWREVVTAPIGLLALIVCSMGLIAASPDRRSRRAREVPSRCGKPGTVSPWKT